MKPEICAHEEYEVIVTAKVNHAYDICRCKQCGAVAHRVPFFIAENRYKKHVG